MCFFLTVSLLILRIFYVRSLLCWLMFFFLFTLFTHLTAQSSWYYPDWMIAGQSNLLIFKLSLTNSSFDFHLDLNLLLVSHLVLFVLWVCFTYSFYEFETFSTSGGSQSYFFMFMRYFGKIMQIIGCPPMGLPPSRGKSWIRHCPPISLCTLN